MKGTRFIEQDKKAVVCHIERQVCNDLLPGFQQWSNGDRHRIVTVINIHNPPPTPKEQREVSVFAEHGRQRINQGHVVSMHRPGSLGQCTLKSLLTGLLHIMGWFHSLSDMRCLSYYLAPLSYLLGMCCCQPRLANRTESEGIERMSDAPRDPRLLLNTCQSWKESIVREFSSVKLKEIWIRLYLMMLNAHVTWIFYCDVRSVTLIYS